MLKKTIVFLIKRLKGREFKFDERVTNRALISIVFSKCFDLIRGFLCTRKMVFIGRGTRVFSTTMIRFGKGVNIGRFCDIDALSEDGLFLGDAVSIGSYSIIKVSGSLTDIGKGITIEANVGIGEFAHIGGAGGVRIGQDTIVGSYLSIHPENHNFSDTNILIRQQGVNRKGIQIGSDCWIGAKVTILDGVHVGDGCVIAAGAVVLSGEYPNHSVIAGVPAKVIGKR